ncbi:MAG: PAS domain S-box protein [Ignavibacteriales bacterium]|nr:PAS domain S-box protein [Ignavibacteriales bacterium]
MITEKTFTPKLSPDHNLILDSVRDGIVAIDREMNLIYFNNSFKERFELFIGEKLKSNKALTSYKGFSRFAKFEDEWNYWVERCFANEKFSEDIEYQLSGKTLHFKLNFTPILKNDDVQSIQLTLIDETLRFQYEELLKTKVKDCDTCKNQQSADAKNIAEERDDAVALLMENVERLQIVFEGSSDGFWDWDIEKDKIFHSKQYFEILGFRNGELKSNLTTWESRVHPDDVDEVLESLHAHLEGKTNQFNCEYRVLTKSNEWKWVLDKGKVAIRDENNNPLRFAGTLSDISERKAAEETLKESEARFVNIANNLPIMLWMSDHKITITYMNPNAKEFIGELEGLKNFRDFVHKEDLRFLQKGVLNVYKNKEKFKGEIRVLSKRKEYRWILIQVVPRVLENGEFIGILTAAIDIHERKEAEKKLLESETQFNEITSVVAEGIFLVDAEKKLKFANPEFYKLLGYNSEEIINTDIFNKIYSHENKIEQNCPIEKVFDNGETVRVSYDYFQTNDDVYLPISFVASPILRDGKITGCVTAFHDITELIQNEEEIKRFVEELQFNKELMEENVTEAARLNEMLWDSETRLKDLNASKDKFFSIISHDLRSPFTSIIGFAEVMLEDIETLTKDEIKEFTNSIYKSSKNIQNLLENLLQWSRVQTGRIEFNPINFDLNNLINDVIALFQVNAARKKINLISSVEKNYTVRADKFMIDTVLRNLVSNSIKFTNSGGEIKVNVEELSEKELTISVSDNGVGIKEEVIEKLFKIDSHVTTKGTEKEKGTGIGLILCKEFVEKHEGKIWVESKIDEGSQFKFILPIKNVS